MSIVKELADERFQERIDKAIRNLVKDISRDGLEKLMLGHLDDYYNNVASQEEREEFLREYEDLPF
jgi:hypothetical protein